MSSAPQKQVAGSRGWFAVAVGLAAVAGYGWGTVSDHDPQPAEAERSAASTGAPRERPRESDGSTLAGAEFVRALVDGGMDEGQLWRQIRSFSEAEVKVALGDVKKLGRHFATAGKVEVMLFYRWGELDPVAANAAAIDAPADIFSRGFSRQRQAVIAAWINQGGAVAAWNAVKGEQGTWDRHFTVPGEVADMVAASLSPQDDAAAFREVLRFDDEDNLIADVLCHARAEQAAESPESRAAFLAATATHPEAYVRDLARELMFEAWAKKDVAAARAGAQGLSLGEEDFESGVDDRIRGAGEGEGGGEGCR
jgi:hypothetical protein